MEGIGAVEVRDILDRFDKGASRALGQNFLVDANVARKIAQTAKAEGSGQQVLEVGPGLGALTIFLGESFDRVVAIEYDRYLLEPLQSVLERRHLRNVEVLHRDVMDVDLGDITSQGPPWILAANLPYNVSSQVIMRTLEGAPNVTRLVVMVQREVGDRLTGATGSKDRSALSVKAQYFAKVSRLMKVPSSVFYPKPNVESSVIVLDRRQDIPYLPGDHRYERIFEIVRESYGHRRQMLRRTLGPYGGETLLEMAGVNPSLRPENLTLDQWVTLGVKSLETKV